MNRRWIAMFDWDGTLIHSLDHKVRNACVLFSEAFGATQAEVEIAYRRHSGIPRHQLFDAILADLRKPPLKDSQYTEMSDRFSQLNLQVLMDPATPGVLPPETPAVLQTLQLSGYPLYVSSSAALQEIQIIARSLQLEDYFLDSGGEILGSQPGFNKGKGHASYVMKKHQALAHQVAFVGDEPSDITLARQAGVVSIAKAGTYSAEKLATLKPDAVINDLSELPDLLKGFIND